MASIAELIDMLMELMRDDDTRREFERDPDATLANRGLAEVTGQDVRDARLMMADSGSAQPRADHPSTGSSSSGSDNDAVREIHYTTTHFEVGDVTTTVITVNDNDTVIVDSFNNDVVAIQDNDTTDIDVISIEDNDTVAGEEEGPEGNENEPGGLEGEEGSGEPGSGADEGAAPDIGLLPGEAGVGSGGELGAGAGAGVGAGPDIGLLPGETGVGSETELGGLESAPDAVALPAGPEASLETELVGEVDDTDSGASEGFAPDQDAGFGAQSELGAEAGFTSETESFDELVG
jgi:hypothetical protein